MAPRRLYETPSEQLSRLLSQAREDGLCFEEAWEAIVRPGRPIVMTTSKKAPARALRWPTDRWDREAWRYAISSAQEGWRRSYEREPMTPAEQALSFLADGFRALDAISAERALGEGIGARAALSSVA